jgi:hypothetical protein
MAKSVSLKPTKAVSNDALKSAELPTRIKILNWGANETLDGQVILDDESTKCFYSNQRCIGRTLAPLDFNHNTVPGTEAFKADKEPRAIAAYGVPTIVPGEGLFYEYLTWTPSGEKSARDYADLSPAVITDEGNRVIGLHSCALTPAGAIANLTFYSADSMSGLMEAAIARGEVEYADEANHKYPIDTEEHVRAAWAYIHMTKNQKSYSASEIAAIKSKISAKAQKCNIELKAESAGVRVPVNAYVTDPYKGIDDMLDEHAEYFRKELGLPDGSKPDDVMKALRAKWEGLKETAQPLPEATPKGSDDPQIRNDGPLAKPGEQPHGVITYSADELKKAIDAALGEKIIPLSAKLDKLEEERNQKASELEKAQRDALVGEATRSGKVIPLSSEEIACLPVKTLASMVKNLKPEVQLQKSALRPMTADGKVPSLEGARERAAQNMTDYFSMHGLKRGEGYTEVRPNAN